MCFGLVRMADLQAKRSLYTFRLDENDGCNAYRVSLLGVHRKVPPQARENLSRRPTAHPQGAGFVLCDH